MPADGFAYGADVVHGGTGNDTIYGDGDGGEGVGDLLYGDDGNDVIYGDGSVGSKKGNDTIHGGLGNDFIFGDVDGAEGANDVIYGEDGDDVIATGRGNDWADGGDGNDILLGGDGAEGAADTLIGGQGNDILIGDGGGVVSSAPGGSDSLDGGAGEDLIVAGVYRPVLPTGVRPLDALTPIRLIQAEWLAPRTMADRISNIRGATTGGLNGNSYLSFQATGEATPPATAVNVFTDIADDRSTPGNEAVNVIDRVFAGNEADWLIFDDSLVNGDLVMSDALDFRSGVRR